MSNQDRIHKIIRDAIAGSTIPASEAAFEIVDKFVIIPKTDLPAIELCGCSPDGLYMNGECWDIGNASDTLEHAKTQAMEYVAHWQFVASGKWQKMQAEEALNRRRNELSAEFTAVNSFGGQLPYTQNLINRIIELEEAAK